MLNVLNVYSGRGMSRKRKETNVANKHNRLKKPNWREADKLAIYKYG